MRRLALLLGAAGTILGATQASRAQSQASDRAPGSWRVEFDNSGLSVQRHSNVAARWEDLHAPRWTKFGRGLPGLNAADLHRRVSIEVGQNLQTPDDLAATQPILDDAPYAAALGVEFGWSADLSIDGDFGVGTALVLAETALELRAGFNVPPGFAFVPDPIGRTIAHDATLLRAGGQNRPAVYLSVIVRAVAMPYFFRPGDRRAVSARLRRATRTTTSEPSQSIGGSDRVQYDGHP